MTEPARVDGKEAKVKVHGQEGGIGETIKVIIQALLIAVVVRTFLFQPFNIPSGSMIPTLLVGDYLFVSKYAYGYSKHSFPFSPDLFNGRILATPPKRGDVVVFKLPRDGQTDYIKRVIGLPGDKIQMKEGRLFINGEMVPREPYREVPHRRPIPVRKPRFQLTSKRCRAASSTQLSKYRATRAITDNTGVYDVPPDNYFMMGDNRDNSTDSRVSRRTRMASAMCRSKISSARRR